MFARLHHPIILLLATGALAVGVASNVHADAALAFGSRPSVIDVSISPDGLSAAYVAPLRGQGAAVYTVRLVKDAKPRQVFAVDGNPTRLGGCEWVSNERLACVGYGVINMVGIAHLNASRLVAFNADGSNQRILSTRQSAYSMGVALGGGGIIDLVDGTGSVLMTRVYIPESHLGSRLVSNDEGVGVDLVDTKTLAVKIVEPARRNIYTYIGDGRGTVRIAGYTNTKNDYETAVVRFDYRMKGSRDWQKLCDYNTVDHTGFEPVAVDPDLNIAYGFKKKDGRMALYSMSLDESPHEQLVFARPDVDVDSTVRIGRSHRVVGVSFATELRSAEYFDPTVKKIVEALHKALPNTSLWVADASLDESKLLISTSSGTDPSMFYLFDRQSHHLDTIFAARNELEGMKLAVVKPITYPASDGTLIPGYLTLPPGENSAKGLPAIVMPHGGPEARDEGGFDWFAQFYASRGYAVLQPNFRGSAGYGDEWMQKNGFRSWPIAIGDVLDAGRWLIKEGIADPAKLGVVGWSYGGYAALQSAVVDQSLFKAVVAVAPVTDLAALKEDHRNLTDFALMSERIGDGATMHEGSPAEHADKIKVPVLLFHGGYDANVNILQSQRMAARLSSAGVKNELVTWDKLDHYLDDSGARELMLRKSDAWLRQAFGMAAPPVASLTLAPSSP